MAETTKMDSQPVIDGEDSGAEQISLDQVEQVLANSKNQQDVPKQMQRVFERELENNKRVEKIIKNTKSNASWFVPVFVALLCIGLLWLVVFYLTGSYPIPSVGKWNLGIGFAIMFVGFIMTMWWQ